MSIVNHDNSAGLKAAVGSTASLGSIMIGLSSYMPGETGKIFALLVPVISSALSWIGIYFYNRWMEPQDVVSWRSALKKDLKEQLAVIKDVNCDDETREMAKKTYSRTKMKLATLRQDYASGALSFSAPDTTPQGD
ncbi:TPA: hypothetical protein SMI12_001042 [Serratia liquefaciens]|uniref:hypothetical protein n=1 Tax=Serratia proteamaculans TaxID=28151 RepID=UPI0021C8B9AE|nr:hypothetical protein [Serratia proteamaculans]HEJ7884119.1 hypothetical protein [Serratia liquefaciens]